MAVIKCKMCGGNLAIQEGMTIAECEFCGSTQTVPSVDNEKKIRLFERANKLRSGCEFDKAYGVYESIIEEFPEEAEAYWGLVLCKYGIEYVDDPAKGRKVPTCHRSAFDSILDDENFEMVMENTDAVALQVYREEVKQLEEIRKGIIEVSSKEAPYDIFICYKETDENGERTIDSVIAQDVYTELTEKGYRVFFSRITLEDRLGQEYEPYIFAALNSAKIMLAFGTKYEYYNAVWVKNEWSRFLKLMASGQKKTLIPCYKDIDAYDMPREFAKLQAQDMGKVGATQDLMRGIEKILQPVQKTMVVENAGISQSIDVLFKRVQIFLNDEDWKMADAYCEKILDIDPENAEAYVGKLLADLQIKTVDKIPYLADSNFETRHCYKKILKYGSEELRASFEGYAQSIKKNIEIEQTYYMLKQDMIKASTDAECQQVAIGFMEIAGYKDAEELAGICRDKKKEEVYQKAIKDIETASDEQQYIYLVKQFQAISGYKDADVLAEKFEQKIVHIRKKREKTKKKAESLLEQFKNWKDTSTMEYKILIKEISKPEIWSILITKNVNYEILLREPTFYKKLCEDRSIFLKLPLNVRLKWEIDTKKEVSFANIKWLVLEKKGSKVLLISKDVLVKRRYHDERKRWIPWEKSELRSWLNNDFYNGTFSDAAKMLIEKTEVQYGVYKSFKCLGMSYEVCQDKLFLLNREEVKKYFSKGAERYCTYMGKPCDWWLLDYHWDKAQYSYVYVESGSIYGDWGFSTYGVRPAMWIDVS